MTLAGEASFEELLLLKPKSGHGHQGRMWDGQAGGCSYGWLCPSWLLHRNAVRVLILSFGKWEER